MAAKEEKVKSSAPVMSTRVKCKRAQKEKRKELFKKKKAREIEENVTLICLMCPKQLAILINDFFYEPFLQTRPTSFPGGISIFTKISNVSLSLQFVSVRPVVTFSIVITQ